MGVVAVMEKPPIDPIYHQIFGAVLGALAQVLYSSPRSLKDTASRVGFGIIAGATLYFVPVEFFEWELTTEKRIAGAVLMAFASGYIAGPVIRWMVSRAKSE